MKNYKIFLNLSDENIKKQLQEMITNEFSLSQNEKECDLFLTDEHTKKSTHAINMLISSVNKIPEFKGKNNIEGFDHYVVYNENDFLVDRVKQAIKRQNLLKDKKNIDSKFIGVRALIPTDNLEEIGGVKLPIIKTFEIRSSKERSYLATEMEKFFGEIEAIIGAQSPILAQYAVEIQEELLMNAIWDANPKHEKQPRTIPVELEEDEVVKLEWGFNGKDFAISVKDNFGRLNPEIMSKYVKFIFKTETQEIHQLANQQVSAGLGMYMILQRANLLSVFITQGELTDVGVVICLKAKRRAKSQSPKAIDIITDKKK